MQTIMRSLVSFMTLLLLVSCGGGGGGSFSQPGAAGSTGSTAVTGLDVQIEATSLPADGVSTTTVTITAKSGEGTVRDAVVSISTDLGSLSSASVTTDNLGVASVTLTAPAASGVATITAKSGSVTDTDSITFEPLVDKLGLSASQYAVHTDNSDRATITATVLDSNNAVVPGATVLFSTGDSDAGELSASSAVTDEQGVAAITFGAGTIERSNQVVMVSATVNGIAKEIPIQIIGTTMSLSPESNSLSADGSDQITVPVLVQDFGEKPIFDVPVCVEVDTSGGGDLQIYASDGTTVLVDACPISGETGVFAGNTGVDGRLNVVVKGSEAGTATLKAVAQGATASADFGVSALADVFTISSPVNGTSLTTDETQQITVSAPDATTVRFATSLGSWAANGATVLDVAVTSGQASAVLQSNIAGTANIVAYDADDSLRSDSIQVVFSAPPTEAAQILLNSSQRVLPVSTDTISYTATLTTEVLTEDDQPVSGAAIAFSLANSTGGGEFLSPPYAVTDEFGRASVTFSSGTKASTQEGVKVVATVLNKVPALSAEYNITITDEAGSVVIGRSTDVASTDDGTAYKLPMSVLVADVNGNPVVNAEVNLSVWPTYYRTGVRNRIDYDNIANGYAVQSDLFANEDANENLILGDTEDFNGDGTLTPPNSAGGSLPRVVTTDENGLASFDLTYLKQNADWVVSRIRASTQVSGTEIVSELEMTLPASKQDACGSETCTDLGDAGTLPDSPFNASCPFDVTPSTDVVYVPVGGSSTVELSLAGPDISGRPVTALVDSNQISGTLNATATQGYTDASGRFVSTLTASSLDAEPGDFATVYYFGSCATTVVRLVVGDEPASPNSITVDVTDSYVPLNGISEVTATVLDSTGTPVSGALVNFTVSTNNTGGKLSYTTASTDSTGRASVTYTAGNVAGTDSVSASVIGVSPALTAAPVDINVDPAAATVKSVTVTTGAGSVPVGQTDLPVNIRAEVTDTDGNPVEGVSVRFVTTAGSFATGVVDQNEDKTTNTDGLADILLYAGNVVGTATVYAVANGFSDQATVEFTPGAAATVSVTASPNTQLPGGSSLLTAYVVDAYGNPVANETVSFELTASGSGNPSLSSPTAQTDANGLAIITYTAGDTAAASSDVVTATLASGGAGGSVTIQVDPDASPVGSMTIEAGATELVADGTSQAAIRVIVKDANGNLMPGKTVNFTTTAGSIALSATTNDSGVAEVQLTSAEKLGEAEITADVDGFRSSVTITFVAGAADAVNLLATPDVVSAGGTAAIRATVTDANGNPVTGETVTFTIGTANSENPALSAFTAVTDDNGVAEVTYTSGSTASIVSDVINAVATNGVSTTATITVEPNAAVTPGSFSLATDSYTVSSDNSDSSTITATVLDVNNAVLPGVTVTFSAAGGQLSASSVVTNADGEASVSFSSGTADRTNRNVLVTARVSGLADETITLTVTGSTLTMTTTASALLPDGSETATLTILAKDAGGQVVPGAAINLEQDTAGGTVQFTENPNYDPVTNSGGESHSGITDQNGSFSTTVVGSAVGNVTITATGLGASANIITAVANAADAFAITSPATGTAELSTGGETRDIVIHVPSTNVVSVSTTLGRLYDAACATPSGNPPAEQITVDPAGATDITVCFETGSNAGTATVTALDTGTGASDSITISIAAPCSQADSLVLQASPSSLQASDDTTTRQATLTARLTTSTATGNQPVRGCPVQFRIAGDATGSGETVSPAIGVTDASGTVTVTFTSGTAGSISSGIAIEAEAYQADYSPFGTPITDTVNVVVTEDAGSVSFGRGTVVIDYNDSTYQLPMSVLVTNASGQTVEGATVTLKVWPRQFSTGYWLDTGNGCVAVITGDFDNEDANRNLRLDAGEDVAIDEAVDGVDYSGDGDQNDIYPADGLLTPHNADGGAVPQTVTTDANGVAEFNLLYLKGNSVWIVDEIVATTEVEGTEMRSVQALRLPAEAKQANDCLLPNSPFNPY